MRLATIGQAATMAGLLSAILALAASALPETPDDVRMQLATAPIKAGSIVTASVRIVLGGVPARPTAVTCAGRIGRVRVRGVPKATRGKASCTYRTPVTAKGKTLRGTVAFTARGDRYVRRFAAKLT